MRKVPAGRWERARKSTNPLARDRLYKDLKKKAGIFFGDSEKDKLGERIKRGFVARPPVPGPRMSSIMSPS